MPIVTTIIARLLALEDWYLGQFVDVGLVTSTDGCWSFNIVNATVNTCGQALAGNVTAEGWNSIMGLVNFVPTLLSVLIYAGPFAAWQPYIPPTPPIPPGP